MPSLIYLLTAYKYAFFVPVAFFESNGLSLVSGVLARVGVINPFVAASIIIATDLGGDIFLYWLGFHKGMKVVDRWGKYLSITEESVQKIKRVFHGHKSKILFVSKITNGIGLASVVLFTAGLSKVPFGIYMLWNIIGEIIWTGLLVYMGYVFGHLYITIDNIIWRVSLIGFAIMAALALWRINKYLRSKII